MNHRPIIDAGPGLNFLSINKERLLIATLGQLSAPAGLPAADSSRTGPRCARSINASAASMTACRPSKRPHF
jgi:hypothetical protein